MYLRNTEPQFQQQLPAATWQRNKRAELRFSEPDADCVRGCKVIGTKQVKLYNIYFFFCLMPENEKNFRLRSCYEEN